MDQLSNAFLQCGLNCHLFDSISVTGGFELFPSLTGDKTFILFVFLFIWYVGAAGAKGESTPPARVSGRKAPPRPSGWHPSPVLSPGPPLLTTGLPRPTWAYLAIALLLNCLFPPCHGTSFRPAGVMSFLSPKVYFAPKPNEKHLEIRVNLIPYLWGPF